MTSMVMFLEVVEVGPAVEACWTVTQVQEATVRADVEP